MTDDSHVYAGPAHAVADGHAGIFYLKQDL